MTYLRDIDRVEFFHEQLEPTDTEPARPGDLRWRYVAAGNSAVLGGPEEGYKHLGDMIADVERVTHRRITHDLELAGNMPTIHIYWSWDQPQRFATGLPVDAGLDFHPGGILHVPGEQGMA